MGDAKKTAQIVVVM